MNGVLHVYRVPSVERAAKTKKKHEKTSIGCHIPVMFAATNITEEANVLLQNLPTAPPGQDRDTRRPSNLHSSTDPTTGTAKNQQALTARAE